MIKSIGEFVIHRGLLPLDVNLPVNDLNCDDEVYDEYESGFVSQQQEDLKRVNEIIWKLYGKYILNFHDKNDFVGRNILKMIQGVRFMDRLRAPSNWIPLYDHSIIPKTQSKCPTTEICKTIVGSMAATELLKLIIRICNPRNV